MSNVNSMRLSCPVPYASPEARPSRGVALAFRRRLAAGLCLPALCASLALPASEGDLDAFRQREELAQAGKATPGEMLEILREGRRLGRPAAASVAFHAHMNAHPEMTLELLRAGADIAVLAGDYAAAVSRYKACLRNAVPDQESGEVLARLYTVMIHFQGQTDSAFQFMRGAGRPYHLGCARKFDGWYLWQCIDKHDPTGYADFLAAMYERREPEPVRRLYQRHLGWLLHEVRDHFQQRTHLGPRLSVIASQWIGDPRTSAELAFLSAFMALAPWKTHDREPLKGGSFAQIEGPALALINTRKDAHALQVVVGMMLGGWEQNDPGFLAANRSSVEALFRKAFPLLSADEQRKFVKWKHQGRPMARELGSPEWWLDFNAKHPDVRDEQDRAAPKTKADSAPTPGALNRVEGIEAEQDGKALEKLWAELYEPLDTGWAALPASFSHAAERKAFFNKLSIQLDRSQAVPVPVDLPNLSALRHFTKNADLTTDELNVLLKIFPHARPCPWVRERRAEWLALVDALIHGASKLDRPALLFEVGPYLWEIANDLTDQDLQRRLADLAEGQVKENPERALALATAGLARSRNFLDASARSKIILVSNETRMRAVQIFNPVSPKDPRHGVYAAQIAYIMRDERSALELYLKHAELVAPLLDELDRGFLLWMVEQNTRLGRVEAAEQLAQLLIAKADKVLNVFDTPSRARLDLLYADIALRKTDYPLARARYSVLIANQGYEGTLAWKDAHLRIAEVDRKTAQFEQAATLLEKLSKTRDRYLQVESQYQWAKVKYDQGEAKEAKAHLNQVFLQDPHHTAARLFEAEVNLALKNYEDVLVIKIGPLENQKILIPGRDLRITMYDNNLSVVRTSTSVEMRVGTAAQDEEFIQLLPKGDSQTHFEAVLKTTLGKAVKGDGVLQVCGDDKIECDFSKRFRDQHPVKPTPPATLTVASDAELFASSGRILSMEEQKKIDIEEQIRARLRQQGQDAPELASTSAGVNEVLSAQRDPNQVKPGNVIHVRLVDPDRSMLQERQAVALQVTTASGDAIDAFALKETEPYSGVFEGAIPTRPAQASALASDSDEARNPYFAISPKERPFWMAMTDNRRPKAFSVDLADSVKPAEMTLLADEVQHKLKSFELQVSPSGRSFTTVAAWPEPPVVWNGGPLAEVVSYVEGEKKLFRTDLERFQSYLEFDFIERNVRKRQIHVEKMAGQPGWEIWGLAPSAGITHPGAYLLHMKALFVQKERKTRTFKLVLKDTAANLTALLTLNGQPSKASNGFGDQEGPLVVSRSLGPGVHRLDLYIKTSLNAHWKFELQQDIPEPPYMAACPAEMFSAKKHPEILKAANIAIANVSPNADQSSFRISFPPGLRTRVIRILIHDYETDAPAIRKITLKTEDGKMVLPAKEDFEDRRRNSILEILPGDEIVVRYKDPVTVAPGPGMHARTLTATYYNGRIDACFMLPSETSEGRRGPPRYEPLRRFKQTDPFDVMIQDPDCDVSPEKDTVAFTVKARTGEPVQIQALETEAHSGVFVGRVFPVRAEPRRASEIRIGQDEDVLISYLDQENTDPGIPWMRTREVEPAWYQTPEFRVFEVTSARLESKDPEKVQPTAISMPMASKAEPRRRAEGEANEVIVPTRRLWAERPEGQTEAGEAVSSMLCGPLLVEMTWPTIALAGSSNATIYLQTAAGRERGGAMVDGPFDLKTPGTMAWTAGPSGVHGYKAPAPGYLDLVVGGVPTAAEPLDDGRFTFCIPLKLGATPSSSLVGQDPDLIKDLIPVDERGNRVFPVRGGDTVFVGFKYDDEGGQEQWLTGKIKLGSDAFFDIMDRRYEKPVTSAFVGEKVYFRLIDYGRDSTHEKDPASVQVRTASGQEHELELLETFEHTGVFKGWVRFTYEGDRSRDPDRMVLPVKYGDEVTFMYVPAGGGDPLSQKVFIRKGANGLAVPFTKRIKDPEMAMRSQLTIAESRFELAKKHRALRAQERALEEITAGKRTLEEAIRDYPNSKVQAQAYYLLANLALELGRDTQDLEARRASLLEAVSRFSELVAKDPESPYAPKSQFKKALAFEELGDFDEACEEFVKLSYKYPEHELVAETIARLGGFFWRKAEYEKDLSRGEVNPVEAEKRKWKARAQFKVAAEVFLRLSKRFPQHKLAAKTQVTAGQAYINAEQYVEAVRTFDAVIEMPDVDRRMRAQALFWCGEACMLMLQQKGPAKALLLRGGIKDPARKAYRAYKLCTIDYPETREAAWSRARLTEGPFKKFDM